MITNMKTNFLKIALFGFIALAIGLKAEAQTLKINPAASSITIQGTSNLHNWESKAQEINGQINANLLSKQVQSLMVEIPVKSIKSGEKLMDTKTYEAFNADKNPNIQFKMTEVNNLQINETNVNVTLTGNLTLAGVTRKVSIKAAGKPQKNNSYNFVGSVALKMTDFDIKPPTAMMGMLKVGNDINLKLNITVDGLQLTQL